MRIRKKDLTTLPLKRATAGTPDRIGGSKPVYIPHGEIEGHLSPIDDSYSVQQSGAYRDARYSFIVLPDIDIRETDRVTISGADFTVKKLLEYGTHKTAILEKAGAKWQP